MKSTQRSRFLVFLTTLLGISLLTLIQSSAFSQSVSGSNERPVPIDVVLQNDSPARIKLLGTNTLSILTESNTYESQTIEFEIQNVSRKKIRTCVFLLASTSQISSPGSYSFTKFEPGSVIKTGVNTDRNKLKPEEKLFLSIDYILFSDGTSWGPDTQKDSEFLSGSDDGEKYAINEVKGFLKDKNRSIIQAIKT